MITAATNYSQTFSTGNTIGAVGNYRIITFEGPILGAVSCTQYVDNIVGVQAGYTIGKFFRWSKTGTSWSMWQSMDSPDPLLALTLNPADQFFIEFKFQLLTVSGNPCDNGSAVSPAVSINGVGFTLLRDTAYYTNPNTRPAVACGCSDEQCYAPIVLASKFSFNPYAINQGINLYHDLSKMVNLTFGFEVQYVRVAPKQRGRDIILGEYTVFGDPNVKCIKVLVPNNEFPDAKPTFNQFGVDFEVPFEVHIDKPYWDSLFGKNTMPQQYDVILFPIMNRLYEVQSTYTFRDFMYQPLYYKLALVKYQNRAFRDLGEDIQSSIDDMAVNPDTLFHEEFIEERERVTKPMQYLTITPDNDPARSNVNRQLEIKRYDLYNNWVLLSQNYYDLESLYYLQGPTTAVAYRQTYNMQAGANISYTFWFTVRANTSKTSIYTRNLLNGMTISGTGVNIDAVANGASPADAIIVTINGSPETFTLPEQLTPDKWFALVVNVSQEFSQVGVNLWTMQDGQTAALRLVHEETHTVTVPTAQTNYQYRINASPVFITNVRIFNDIIPTEEQSNTLGQLIVKDSNLAILIDNAKPIFRLPVIIDPK